MAHVFRTAGSAIALVIAGVAVSGCVGPTYGTDKSSGEQLVEDIGEAFTFGTTKKQEKIAYQPRGQLVKPANEKQLVAPQKDLASNENPQWVESPEQARDRLRSEADENSDNGNYRSPLMVGVTEGKTLTPEQQQKAYREARKLQDGRYADRRRFMSDPPLDYRKVDDPAALNDLGESEAAKEKRRMKDAAIAGTGRKWWQVFD